MTANQQTNKPTTVELNIDYDRKRPTPDNSIY